MESLVSVRDKEDIASTLVHIMQKLDKAKEFLTEVIIGEVLKQGMSCQTSFWWVNYGSFTLPTTLKLNNWNMESFLFLEIHVVAEASNKSLHRELVLISLEP